MKRSSILLSFLLCFSGVFAKELMPVVMLEKSTFDRHISEDSAVYIFNFDIPDNESNRELIFAIDQEENQKVKLIDNHSLEITTSSGEHSFQFYYTDRFYEVSTGKLLIRSQYKDEYSVRLEDALYPIEVEKPVIYFYPEKETETRVKLKVKGELAFTYPLYKDQWIFTANPNGDLTFGDKTYNYLFWESVKMTKKTDIKEGFIVEGRNVIEFLEEKLTLAGLNSKEQADFITYWGPQLQRNHYNYIRFEFNDDCDKYAELDIEPKPDNLYRINMLWKTIDSRIPIENQEMIRINRDGFTVVEWGGQKIP